MIIYIFKQTNETVMNVDYVRPLKQEKLNVTIKLVMILINYQNLVVLVANKITLKNTTLLLKQR